MIKNCFIWTRVSTKHQEENGGSLDDQKCKCEKYAAYRAECDQEIQRRTLDREVNQAIGDAMKRIPWKREV